MYAFDTSRNPLQPYLMFHSILNLLQETYFWANFNSFFDIILYWLKTVSNETWIEEVRNVQSLGGRNRLRLPKYQKKWIKNIGEQIIVIFINLENRWKRLHMLGKPSFLDLEPSTMIHADSVSFLKSADDRIRKYSSMFGFPWKNPSVNSQWYIKQCLLWYGLVSKITISACN